MGDACRKGIDCLGKAIAKGEVGDTQRKVIHRLIEGKAKDEVSDA